MGKAQPKSRTPEQLPLRQRAAFLVLLFGWILGPLVLTLQIIGWLKTGHWPTLTLGDVFLMIGSGTNLGAWIASPNSWYGLHSVVKILLDTELCIAIFLLGPIIGLILLHRKSADTLPGRG